ncbi:MAG: DNA primase [Burkholderiaceae bacterium]|nr:DNA primase [Burkholderiaceae bacterium]
MIPQGFIQDLLARVDIVDVVGRHVQLKKGGQNFLGLCPFHGEKTPSFTVSPSKQFYHCFGCGAHGTAIGFLMDQRGLSYVESIHELAQQVGMTVPDDVRADRDQAQRSRGLTELLATAADFYRRELKSSTVAIDYLKGRGITGQAAARFALGFAPDNWQPLKGAVAHYDDPRLAEAGLVIVGDEGKRYDRFRGRVMFPIRNRRGAVIGFGARIMGAGEPKYLNSPETPVFHKGQELYGLFEAQEAIRSRKRAIVCEGYMDVIQLSQAGFGESVAALGTAVTAQHVTTLLRLTDHVVFSFDGDAAGRKAARRALEATLPVITESKRASFVLLPQGEDPDSLIKGHGAGAFEDELARALPLSRWFARCLAEGRNLDEAEDRAALLAEAQPMLESMQPGPLRLQLTRELAGAARTAVEDIETLFGLKKWRRLPERPAGDPRRQSVAAGDLKARILRQLVSFPELAREFNAQIAAESLESVDPLDRQIAEVWRAATAGAGASSGALLEALADSEFAASYRAIAAQDMAMADDAAAARDDLAAGFQTLELRRVEAELSLLVRGELTEDTKLRIRELSDRRIQLKEPRPTAG